MQKEKVRVLNIQLLAILFSFLSGAISYFLTYNQKLSTQNKKTIFSKKQLYNINLFNRILVVSIAFTLLYISYREYKITKVENENLRDYKLQIDSSLLTVVATLISLYIVATSTVETVVDIENPII